MNAQTLLEHLYELGCEIKLSLDARSLELDARADALTDELLELVREHKEEIVQLVYEAEERAAIIEEARPGTIGDYMLGDYMQGITLTDGSDLLSSVKHDPALVSLFAHLSARGGASVELVRAA
jgi:hypothetical protein